MSKDTALFDLTDTGELTPPLFESAGHGVALTPYGRHQDLGPGTWTAPHCGDAHYGSITSGNHRVWIWHACSQIRDHNQHKCDRCEETW